VLLTRTAPLAITGGRGAGRRVDDVREQHRGQHPIMNGVRRVQRLDEGTGLGKDRPRRCAPRMLIV
jgi:hypothetical protein